MAEATHLLGLPRKHKPKDVQPQGAGSGLDADKVDGLHASELGGGGPHASSHETGGGDKVHFAALEHDETDPALHDALTSAPHISQADKDKIHDRLHALGSIDHPDLEISTPADGQVLGYEAATSKWKNKTPIEDWAVLSLVEPASNVDYVEFTGLDINSHKFYTLFLALRNPQASNTFYYLFINGDYATTNYYEQDVYGDGTLVGAVRRNYPMCGWARAGQSQYSFVTITREPGGCVHYAYKQGLGAPSAVTFNMGTGMKTATVTNITSIRISAQVAGGIGAGSKLMLCRSRKP